MEPSSKYESNEDNDLPGLADDMPVVIIVWQLEICVYIGGDGDENMGEEKFH